jgi:hypothetical protein
MPGLRLARAPEFGDVNASQSARRRETPVIQRSRDLVTGQLTLDYFIRKAAEGWKLAAMEWFREVEGDIEAPPLAAPSGSAETPYGLRVSADGLHLEPNPLEHTVLLLILDKIIQEKRITEIAAELNSGGFRTRRDTQWTPTGVFELLPRLIEAGPSLLGSSEWQALRRKDAAVG